MKGTLALEYPTSIGDRKEQEQVKRDKKGKIKEKALTQNELKQRDGFAHRV